MNCELVYNLNKDDLEQVIHLLSISFPVEYSYGLVYFEFFIKNCPDKCFQLIKIDNGKIVGVNCILNRKMNYSDTVLDVVGLSYMAVHPEYRDFTVTGLIKKSMFSYLDLNSDLSMGFARKVMDNYWYPYGFLGFTNFGCISFNLNKFRKSNYGIFVSKYTNDDLLSIKKLFDDTYTGEMYAYIRTIEIWHYYVQKLKSEHKEIDVIKSDTNNVIGYFIRDNNNIEEICVDTVYFRDTIGLISDIVEKEVVGASCINFKIGINHLFSKYLITKFEHSIATRFVWKGGHIVKVTNLYNFFQKILPVIESRLIASEVQRFNLTHFGYVFLYSGNNLSIEKDVENVFTEVEALHYWQKLIFGVCDPDSLFYNFDVNKQIILKLRIMFPLINIQIPVLDHF